MLQVGTLTAIFNAVFVCLGLKLLHLFHLVKWHPTSFLKKQSITEQLSAFERWLILGLLILLATSLVFVVSRYIHYRHIMWVAFILSLVISVLLNFIIEDLPIKWSAFKELSIPFLVLVLISFRFVCDTASFHYTEKTFSHTK